MEELINRRTPEQIRFNVMECAHGHCLSECPYDGSDDCTEELLYDALALIKHLEAKVPKWISVEDRMPDTTNVYLIHIVHRYNKNDGYRSMDVRLFLNGEFEPWQGLPDIYEVTHWMPLPEPPKEENE